MLDKVLLLVAVSSVLRDSTRSENPTVARASFKLSDVYGAIAFYLKNKDAVEKYLQQREKLAESIKQRIETIQPDLSQIRSRLLSQRNL